MLPKITPQVGNNNDDDDDDDDNDANRDIHIYKNNMIFNELTHLFSWGYFQFLPYP